MRSIKWSLSFICLALFATLISFSPVPETDIPADVLSYTNSFRKAKGKTALTMRDDLNKIAQKHSENMAKGSTKFGHNGFNKRFADAKGKISDFKSYAENVAYGVSSGKEAVNLWKNSSGHRKNMLGDYRYIGIGIARARNGDIYYTQVFVN